MITRVIVWEVYERSIYRWIWAAVITFWLLWLSLAEKDWRWVVLLLAVIWAYVRYQRKTQHDIEIVSIEPDHLQIEWKTYYRSDLSWFSLDYKINHIHHQRIPQTLFLYTKKQTHIYTFRDTHENVVLFTQLLQDRIPFIQEIHLDRLANFLRFLKL